MKNFKNTVCLCLSTILIGGCAVPKKQAGHGVETEGDPDILRAASNAAALIKQRQCGPAQKAMGALFDAQESAALPMAFGALWGVLRKKVDVRPVMAYLDDVIMTNDITSGYFVKCVSPVLSGQATGYWPNIAEADGRVDAALNRGQCAMAKDLWGRASDVFRNGFLEEPRAIFASVKTPQEAAHARENLKIFNEHLSVYSRMVYQCGR